MTVLRHAVVSLTAAGALCAACDRTSAPSTTEATAPASSVSGRATESASTAPPIDGGVDGAGAPGRAASASPTCPASEIYVPASSAEGFVMGARHSGTMDQPHRVVISRPFCMDATEVTVRAYQQCVEDGRCEAPRWWGKWTTYPSQPDHPVNKVHWLHARTYCEYRGKTLPTEAQWEWAATGGDGRKWPWGDEPPDCTRADFTLGTLPSPGGDAGCHGGGPSAVGSHPAGAKHWPGGAIHDLAGNVWEWCLDNYAPYPAVDETDPNHFVAERAAHVVRGGGWNRSARGILSSYRGGATYDYQVPGLGFRCVRNLT
jgi:formylglycine-generating enzyme required for sulfatase activity